MATKAFLEKAYLAYFGRPVDPTGLTDYAASTDTQVADAFAASAESKALYGTTFNYAQINAIYLALFNREAEKAGLEYWYAKVADKTYTAAGAAIAILNGAQNADLTAIENKLAASAAFSAALDTSSEMIGYSGDAAAASARAFLSTVTTTAATAAAVDAAVASAVAAKTAVAGQTFTLTTGVEDVVGTSGADTFVGLFGADNGAGDDTTTISNGDSIDGGAGNDTLNITVSDDQSEANVLTLSSVETVSIRDLNGADLDAATWDGVAVLRFDRSTAATAIDNVQNGVAITLNNIDGATDVTVTYDTDALGTATYDQAINLVGDTDVDLAYVTAGDDVVTELTIAVGAGSSKIDLTGEDLVETLTVSGSGDLEITEAATAFNALATVAAGTMTGDLTIVLTESAEAVTLVSGSGDDTITSSGGDDDLTTGAGDDAITVAAAGDVTVDAGAGDDTVTITVAGLDDADTIDGGAGTNRIVVDADDLDALETAIATDENVTGFAEAEINAAATADVTFDADASSVEYVEVSATVDAAADGTNIDLAITIGQGTVEFSASQATDTDSVMTIAGVDTSDDVTVALSGGVVTISSLVLTDLESVTIESNADAATTITALTLDGVESLVLSGEQDLDIDGTTLADSLVTVDASEFTGVLNFELEDAEGVEITLGDFGAASSIILDADEAGSDTIVISGALENTITITNFTEGNGVVADVLDLSALDVNSASDLTFTDNAGDLEITSDLFDGTITLVGVAVADLNNSNFVFA